MASKLLKQTDVCKSEGACGKLHARQLAILLYKSFPATTMLNKYSSRFEFNMLLS